MNEALRWGLITALLAGTNAGNYLGFAKPEAQAATEMQAAANILSKELEACYVLLKECYAACGAGRTVDP